MNVLWIKDNNIGHEKQVQVLLDELSNNLNLNFDVGDAEIVGTISSKLESFDTFDLEMSFNTSLSQNIPWYVAILGGFPAAAGAVVVTEVLEDGINQITETKYGISGSADNLIVETRQ